MNIFEHIREGLTKTRAQILASVGLGVKELDSSFYESLEEALVSADIGIDLTVEIIGQLKKEVSKNGLVRPDEAYDALKQILTNELSVEKVPDDFPPKPWVILVVGVNGVGKTTTIGKLAHEFRARGKTVMLGAADTFRAGAIEQLSIWADRTGSEFIAQQEGADPASVAYDAMDAARNRGTDVLILDTAGRLHNKINLMNELEKMLRVIKRNTPHAPNEILLVIDATTGQNAIRQTQVFNEILKLTGLIITKLDGTAKGGIALALARRFGIPVRKIGVGEGIDDLQDFIPADYVEAMFGNLSTTDAKEN